MPDISRLVIEIDSKGVVTATGNLDAFAAKSKVVGKETDELVNKFGAFQLIINKLPGPLKSVASGLLGIVNPAQAVIGAVMEIGEAAIKYVQESIDAFLKFETIKTNLMVVSSSVEEATSTFNELKKFSIKTPFDLESISQAGVMLRQAGMSASEMIPILEGLGNVSNGNADVFNRMALNLAQVANVGKATSMDMRQFMMAGIPINQLLKDIGKEGSTAFEDIRDAILAASAEGGRFEGAMEKGTQTIAGQKTIVEGLKEQYKALWAEMNGIPAIVKIWLEWQEKYYTRKIEALNEIKNIGEIIDGLYSDDPVTRMIAEYEQAVRATKTYNDELMGEMYVTPMSQEEIDHWDEVIRRLKPVVEAHRQLVQEQEEYNRQLELSVNKYKNIQSRIEEAHASTEEGTIRRIRASIEEFEAMRGTMVLEEQRIFKGTYLDEQGRTQAIVDTVLRNRSMTEQEASDLEDIIRRLYGQLENATKGSNNITREFEEWVKLLSQATGYTHEQVEALNEYGTVTKYFDDILSIQNRFFNESEKHGTIYEALGLDRTDMLDDAANRINNILFMMTESRLWDGTEESYLAVLEEAIAFNNRAKSARYDKEYNNLIEVIGLSKEELRIRELIEQVGSEERANEIVGLEYEAEFNRRMELIGLSEKELRIRELISQVGSVERANEIINAETSAIADNLKKELERRKELIWLTEEQIRLLELQEQFGEEKGLELFNFEQEIEKIEALRDVLDTLKDTMKKLMGTGFLDFTNELGRAFRQGADFSLSFNNALSNMLRGLIDAMPNLLLNVGLQLIPKNLALGLAFIGASGLMSFVSGMIGDADSSGQKSEAERLRNLQQQLLDLIAAQRQQQEYFLTQKRRVDNSITVNDAIITPRGVVHTHPEDYIIATKRPQDLMSGGSSVIVQIINKTDSVITQNETITGDGEKLIEVTIDRVVQNGLASGKYQTAIDMGAQRRSGRRQQS